ncbi:synaptonemal complex protein 1 isoform X2 [Hyla sarda]|uniref:synaptonemal complex protein 1 isoform X2 n=1 Tax=Hyla sarda TaxID=327740 RepID=UPI0024C3EB42|nr:synaptonemal complex protein 1 isoform X2 [Hyla sarda]
MEQEIPFKIFPLQRISSSHVSAVKPQAVVENTSFFQNLKSSHGNENKSYTANNSDCISLKVSPLTVIEEENPESISQLYVKLHREAEKIKKWKSNVEFEIKDQETKVQEKRNIIDAQKRVIHELQFENGQLRLELEDVVNENEDLVKQNNATRHLCGILKDTCDRAAEKANMYENEIDDTRHYYNDLNNNIERMIMAFEELRIQAENSRQELYNQIKQDNEKRQEMQKDHNLQWARCKKQVDSSDVLQYYLYDPNGGYTESNQVDLDYFQILELTRDREDNENKILNLNIQLNESTNRIQELNEVSDNYQKELEKHKKKADETIPQLEAANLALQNTENALKNSEKELLKTQTLLAEGTKERHLIAKELEETRSHVLQLSSLQSKVDNLAENLSTQLTKLEEREAQMEAFKLEVMNKSNHLDEVRKENEILKKEIEQLQSELEESRKVETDLEKKVAVEKSESIILKNKVQDLLISQENLKEQLHSNVKENTNLMKSIGDLKEFQIQLQEKLRSREDEINNLNIKMNTSSVDIERYSDQIEELKTEVSQREEKYQKLKIAYENIITENEAMSRKIEEGITNIQRDCKASKQQRDQAEKKIGNLEQTIEHLRKENESLKEQLKAKDEEFSIHYNDKKKLFENEFLKKEKQQKTLENKLSTLKKQVENKNKTIEELQQENRSLKRKIKEGCQQCSVLEAEVNELQAQTENSRIQQERDISSMQLEIANSKTKEETLHQEVERLKLSSEEALRLQRETDIKCQHKIAEMMALMEKHKHQYDKLLEQKDAELAGLRVREQEIAAARDSLTELSQKNNEIATLRKHLQQEKEQKEKNILKTSMQHKEVQVVITNTPIQSTKIGDMQYSASSVLKKTPLKQEGRMSDNKNTLAWSSSKNKRVVPKTFSVKTPPKYENITAYSQDSEKKKRKVALEFDFHSDSSDPTDVLGICGNESMLKSLYHLSHSTPNTHTIHPKKIFTERSLKSPGSALKSSTSLKRMREAGWAAISKVDRRRKMKAAEKIFS